jgi:hypothetical protein
MCGWKEELNIKPVYRPIDETDEYEWIFNTEDPTIQLSLNVQNIDGEYAELSNNTYGSSDLNVLVCLFVPSKKLSIKNVAYDNSVMLNFNDKIFIESSNADYIMQYFSDYNNILNDLSKVFEGTFVSKENELKVKNSFSAIQQDLKILKYLENIKLFDTKFDPNAADFLDTL